MRSMKPRILYVDEDAGGSFTLNTRLKLADYDPVTVNFTSDALQFAQCENFDLYLLSRRFRVGPGVFLCQQLHEISPQTPIVFLSDESASTGQTASIHSGSDEYTAKAGNTREILDAVRLALAGRKHASTGVNS